MKAMREHCMIELEKAKVQIVLCKEVLNYTDIPKELQDKMTRLFKSCLESQEYFLAKLAELDK
jgi:chemotaxis methyl-accepting protein methylase